MHPGIACLGYVHYGIACLAPQASDCAGALWMACLACDWFPFARCLSKYIYCKTDCDWVLL